MLFSIRLGELAYMHATPTYLILLPIPCSLRNVDPEILGCSAVTDTAWRVHMVWPVGCVRVYSVLLCSFS